jgi:hypothetical protein
LLDNFSSEARCIAAKLEDYLAHRRGKRQRFKRRLLGNIFVYSCNAAPGGTGSRTNLPCERQEAKAQEEDALR